MGDQPSSRFMFLGILACAAAGHGMAYGHVHAMCSAEASLTTAYVEHCPDVAGTNLTDDHAAASGPLTVLITSVTPPSCFGMTNGAINITVGDGVPPFTYAWSNGATTEDINGIPAGLYMVMVTDGTGATASAGTMVTQPPALSATATSSGHILCPATTSTITVVASGGTAPYSGTGGFTVPAGTYSYPVTDANGCATVTNNVNVQFFPVSNVNTGVGYTDIQQAVTAASPGHTINVCAGTYLLPPSSTILVNKALTLRGANHQVDPTVDPSIRGPESRIVVNHASGRAMTITASNVSVSGFEFEVAGGRDGINVLTTLVPAGTAVLTNVNISNNIFRSTTTTTGQKNGILFGESSTGSNPAGTLENASCTNMVVNSNLFEMTSFATTPRGVVFTTHFDWHAYANISVTNNRFRMATASGRAVVASALPVRHEIANLNLGGNVFSGYIPVELTKAVTPTIVNNRFTGYRYYALGLGSSAGGAVRGNTIDGTGAAVLFSPTFWAMGIWLYGGTDFGTPANGPTGNNADLVIENNVISNLNHPTETALTFRGIIASANAGPRLFIRNNIFSNVQTGVTFPSTTLNDQSVEYNSFTNYRRAIWCGTGSLTMANCNWYNTLNPDTIASRNIGNIDFSPWLTLGTDTDPAIGFQPVSGACIGSPLPVELVMFDAEPVDDRVDLHWITATELNNDHFTVERSVDMASWQAVATVSGAGTSQGANSYSVSDMYPLPNTSYYRLRQTDLDGTTTTSEAVPVTFGMHGPSVALYPNPANTSVTLQGPSLDGSTAVRVVDALGRTVPLPLHAGEGRIDVDVSILRPGSYTVIAEGPTIGRYTGRLVVER
jgi:hypothetical protein